MIWFQTVKFKGALFSGVLCGTLFQVVQWLFVTGQVYVSKYNAIYGSFAFLPLLLIWLQLSWLIALAGVVLTYAWQNFDSFAYRDKAKEMSQSYTNNLAIAVLTQAVKRFKSQNGLLTRSDIIRNYDIPGTLADRLLSNLQQAGLLNRVSQDNGDKEEYAFQPAFDPDDFTLNDTLKRLARIGKSDFIPKADTSFTKVWSAIKAIQDIQQQANDMALLDLPDADNAQTDICDETK